MPSLGKKNIVKCPPTKFSIFDKIFDNFQKNTIISLTGKNVIIPIFYFPTEKA